MTKFHVGDTVEVIRDTYKFPKGTRGVVTIEPYGSIGKGNTHIEVNGKEVIILGEDAKLVKPTKNQRITALEEKVKYLESVIDSLTHKKWTEDDLNELEAQVLTNNQKRAAIIEKAKKFVEEHTTPNSTTKKWREKGAISFSIFGVIPYLTVNAEKRTVTAVLKGAGDGRIIRKEVAKCAPTDVFNEHIGKAIALGRALGLDVSEFEQAIQPTHLKPGMIVALLDGDLYKVKYDIHGDLEDSDQVVRITNDTDAVYN